MIKNGMVMFINLVGGSIMMIFVIVIYNDGSIEEV